ncbi:hypothetical protein [Tautonia marina]|uniref:hypothetical protein n=1 Tax=Tautonia marina TaxID=2653855 RepID=UPI0012610D71|nr:hypothetical protein [Tautonia marina]
MRTLVAMMLSAVTLPVVIASVSPAIDRLAEMPLQTRRELSESLARFDQLLTTEQQAIRELDRELAKLDPEERKRYLDLMRRFGAWFRRLDDETRRAFQSASTEQRFEMLREHLGPDSSPEAPGFDFALWFRADTFNPIPLYDAVTLLRIWALLDDEARQQLESARSLDETIAMLRQFARERNIEHAPAVREAFQTILEDQGRLGQRGLRLMPEVTDLRAWLLDGVDPPGTRPFGGGPGTFGRRPPGAQGPQAEGMRMNAARLSAARLSILRLAELEYLRRLRERPDGASAADLATFEARLPRWYRDLLDPLPPEVVRLRVRGLRQLAVSDPDLMRWFEQAVPVTPAGTQPNNSPSEGRPSLVRPF